MVWYGMVYVYLCIAVVAKGYVQSSIQRIAKFSGPLLKETVLMCTEVVGQKQRHWPWPVCNSQ